ncbi:hypothetical protein DUNSADRAFT_8319 [Dunaliella salina]|uniref:Uncharacterized protein n=1 Tax=Dunaliella salina TaxID=3046 RepID=A0ABQ7H5X7_DUNSA|nr:hypothetical protein DUNSADRAFT_8319 [Dunaliella salina]|eukprot:KAF5842256.1 hypothetical protein DUNSADRAFT_8319 [Dunaliella salina]
MLRSTPVTATGPASQRLAAHRPGFDGIRANKAPRAPQTVTRASSATVPAVVEKAKGITLARTSGAKEPVEEVVQGKTVLGLLRHLG